MYLKNPHMYLKTPHKCINKIRTNVFKKSANNSKSPLLKVCVHVFSKLTDERRRFHSGSCSPTECLTLKLLAKNRLLLIYTPPRQKSLCASEHTVCPGNSIYN